ncbi:MAG: hypothetical protein U0231_16400 [Nitrospiraceae bacterium]
MSSCEGVVPAVGDKVDETVGLPYKDGVFVTNPNKTGNDPDDAFFQAYDEKTGKVVDGRSSRGGRARPAKAWSVLPSVTGSGARK